MNFTRTLPRVRPQSRVTVLVRALSIGGALLLASPLVAQSLPPEVTSAPTLAGDAAKRIAEFASAQLARLKGTDHQEREAARDDLLAPLDGAGVSLAFRLEYSKALAAELGRIAQSTDDHAAVNALRVSGRLGTPQGVDTLRNALKDARPPVRLASARTLREAVRATLSMAQSPVSLSKLQDATDDLAKALSTEADPLVAKTMVLAIDATRAGSPTGEQGKLAGRAVERLSAAMADRAAFARKSVAPSDAAPWTDAIVTALDAVRRTFIDPQRSDETRRPELRKNAAMLAGQSVAYLKHRLAAHGANASPDAPSMKVMANAASVVLLLINGGEEKQVLPGAFNASLDSGDPTEFNKAADTWLAPGGRLSKPPFSLEASAFTR